MYENWKIKQWETPVTNIGEIVMESLFDNGSLYIIVRESRVSPARRFCIVFSNPPAYRNILEEYRLSLWKEMSVQKRNTLLVDDSTWIASFQKSEPLLAVNNPELQHYMICTENDVIEVLSQNQPIIEELPSVDEALLHPKATIYYRPEDNDIIEEIFRKLRSGE